MENLGKLMLSGFPLLLPLAWLCIGIITGSLLENIFPGDYLSPGLPWGFVPILLAMAVFLLTANKSTTPHSTVRLNKFHYVWIALLFTGTGLIAQWASRPCILPSYITSVKNEITGKVVEASTQAYGDTYLVEVSSIIPECRKEISVHHLKIRLTTDGYSAAPDDVIRFTSRISRIKDNPDFRPSGFTDHMRNRRVIYQCSAVSSHIETIGIEHSLHGFAIRARDRIAACMEKSKLNHETSSFIISILLGDRTLLSERTFLKFSNAGIAHILALSGLHVSIIVSMLIPFLIPFRLTRKRNIGLILSCVILWLFAIFTGLAPSTTRACVMATFIAVASILQRKNSSFNALFAAGIIILTFNPNALYEVGFQLSFICVACIIAFTDRLNPIDRHFHPKLYAVTALIIVSIAATAGTWTLTSHYFGKIPLLFLPANLLAIPLLPIYIWVAATFMLLNAIGINPSWMIHTLQNGYELFEQIAALCSLNGTGAIDYKAPLAVSILWMSGILILAIAVYKHSKVILYALSAGILVTSLVLIPLLPSTSDSIIFQNKVKDISVTFYDRDKPCVACFKRNAISICFYKSSNITVIDCVPTESDLKKITEHNQSSAGKCYLTQVSDLESVV